MSLTPSLIERTVVPMTSVPICFLGFDGMQSLDMTGPFEVFNGANRHLADTAATHRNPQPDRYSLSVVATTTEVTTESGLGIRASLLPVDEPAPHTLIIPGGRGVHEAARNPVVTDWVTSVAAQGTRIATVCTGTFLAGAAGLLDNKTVTTHWASTERLQAAYPLSHVDADALFVGSGQFWSSAGVTAGVDLALALVEEDHGVAVAQEIARWLVVFLRRPGGQSQFAPPIWNKQAETTPIRKAQDLINNDPAADLSVGSLASQVGVSARHFSRLFHDEVGQPPGHYVETVRVSAARHHLEQSTDSVKVIARRCGFSSPEILRRAFHRHVGTSPDAYRTHHSTRSASGVSQADNPDHSAALQTSRATNQRKRSS